MKSIALPPTWYSPVCSALERLSSNRGKFALVGGGGDLSDSLKNGLDTAITSGDVYSHSQFLSKKRSSCGYCKTNTLQTDRFVFGESGRKQLVSFAARPSRGPVSQAGASYQITLKSAPRHRIALECLSGSRCVGWLGTLSVGAMLSSGKEEGF